MIRIRFLCSFSYLILFIIFFCICFPHFCKTCNFNIRLQIHQLNPRSNPGQYRNSGNWHTDNNPFSRDHHNLIFFADCFHTYNISRFFCNFIAFYAFSTTILRRKFIHERTFAHTFFRNCQKHFTLRI